MTNTENIAKEVYRLKGPLFKRILINIPELEECIDFLVDMHYKEGEVCYNNEEFKMSLKYLLHSVEIIDD